MALRIRSSRPFSGRTRRSGQINVAVLGVALIVSMTGLCALNVARVQLRNAGLSRDWQTARRLAGSGVEQAIAVLNDDATWPTRYSLGTEYPSPATSVDGGSMTWKLTDVGNGKLRIDGIGRVKQARCVLSVTAIRPGSDALGAALMAGSEVRLNSNNVTLTATDAPVATNGTFQNGGTVTGNVEAQNRSGNLPVSGTATVPGPFRPLPDPSQVFGYYTTKGTDITAGVFGSSSTAVMSSVLLSPYANPYGLANAEGIYVIDAAKTRSLTIQSSRIVGTVVVLNADKGVTVQNEVNWEAAFPNYPALMVQGPLTLAVTDGRLDEVALGKNFNPLLTPWQGGTDIAADDNYPSSVGGLVYCSDKLTFSGLDLNLSCKLQGVMMADGSCVLERTARVSIKYDDDPYWNPPPGFEPITSPTLMTGSWRQSASY